MLNMYVIIVTYASEGSTVRGALRSICYDRVTMVRRISAAINWLIKGEDGKTHLVQFPNPPLIGWALLLVASYVAPDSALKSGLATMSTGFLAIWAYLEATQGVSRIRRILGMIVGVVLIYSCF